MEQLAESWLQVGGWDDHTTNFLLSSLDTAGQRLGRKFHLVKDEELALRQVSSGTFAYYDNTFYLKNLATRNKTSGARNLHVMRDCVINMPISLGLQRNSALKPRVDRFLRRVIEAGLVHKWLGDVQIATTPVDSFGNDRESVKALVDLPKFYGALVALGAGLFISVLALIAEILYWKFAVTHRPNYDPYQVMTRKPALIS